MAVRNKRFSVFKSNTPASPLVVLLAHGDEGAAVREQCLALGVPAFHLATICVEDWNNALSPFKAPPTAEGGVPFGGNAEAFLNELGEVILPEIFTEIGEKPRYTAIAGYSLAGLFSLFALHKSALFSAAVSASGSFWFPGFLDFIKEHETSADCVYLSLGDREKYTSNCILRTVEENTLALFSLLKERNIQVHFEMNKGNHFKQAPLRTAKGIKWILENKS